MMARFFNLLFTLSGIWIAICLLKFNDMAVVLTGQMVLILMFAPLAVTIGLYYLIRPQTD